MILTGLLLKNFRIHRNISLSFSETLNYIVGGNGKGKTSILEAAYYLCTTKSFSSKDNDAVNFDSTDFEINGKFKDITEDDVRLYFSVPDNRKYYFKNEKLISKSSQVIGSFPVVILTPADHSITQGAPAERRKFVDSVISQASSTYLDLLLDYNRTLKQRSAILNLLKESRSPKINLEFEAWTEKLVDSGIQLIRHRQEFLKDFNEYIKISYKKIVEEKETPSIQYFFLDGTDSVNPKDVFTAILNDKKEEEIRRTLNLVGPHKDDFIFSINDINLRTFGSQGQHKTFQTALRFAEFFYLKNATGKTPIFLLDDVFGELDAYRAGKISDYLKDVGQAFITLTDFADFSFLKKTERDFVIKLNDDKIDYA